MDLMMIVMARLIVMIQTALEILGAPIVIQDVRPLFVSPGRKFALMVLMMTVTHLQIVMIWLIVL